MARKIFYVVLVLLFQTTIYAYRPFMTEDAGVSKLGEQKIELGFIGNKENENWYNYISFLYGVGLGKAEILVETPYCINKEARGLENIILAAKINVLGTNEETGMLTTKVCYELPDDCYGVSAIVTKQFGNLLIHGQIGLRRHFDNNVALFGIGLDYKLLQHLSIVIDNFGEHDSDTLYHRILTGIIYTINDAVALDLGTGFCYANNNKNYREYFTVAGISLVF